LPSDNEDDFSGAKVKTSGWGDTRNKAESTMFLREVEVSVMNTTACNEFAKRFRRSITNRMICAYPTKKDSCPVSF
jgi:hypothetical protein